MKEASPLDRVDVLEAYTFGEAVELAKRVRPEIYVIGYHFDEMRPYRLIRYVRSVPWGVGAEILVIRALPLYQPVGDKAQEEIRKAYVDIGADDFLLLYSDAKQSQVLSPLRQAIEERVTKARSFTSCSAPSRGSGTRKPARASGP